MLTLTGHTIYLRALEPEDLDFIYALENNETVWEVSNTQTPYSRFLIRQYLENAHQDIYEAKQLRLAICLNETGETIGLIDIFDFDPKTIEPAWVWSLLTMNIVTRVLGLKLCL